MRCPNCDRAVSNTVKDCRCGWNFEAKVLLEKKPLSKFENNEIQSEKNIDTSEVLVADDSKESYSALSFYTSILKGVGVLLIIIGIIIAISGVFQLGDGGYIGIGSIFSGIATAFGGLVSMAIGELICVLMATEGNTRKIAAILEAKKI